VKLSALSDSVVNLFLMEHIEHLSKDKKLREIISLQDPYILVKRKDIYLLLCKSIVSQQLSTRVSEVIYGRFLDLYKNKKPTAQQIIDTPFEKLRGVGLSNAKANYLQNVCRFFIEEKLTDAKLHKMSDEDIIEKLTQIKGVGKWTVEMILMFALGREDIFAMDDLIIQQRFAQLYKLDVTDKKKLKTKMIQLSAKWSPYRTYVCRYLWGWNNK
jgi:DNA-3-methyladenine glycosylase II